MARYKLIGTTPIQNRRHGVCFAEQRGIPTMRANAIPVQPVSNARANGQLSFANAAWSWGTLTPTQLADWANYPGNLGNAYAYFLQYNQYMATWYNLQFPDPPSPYLVENVWDIAAFITPSNRVVLNFIVPNVGELSGATVDFHLYWELSGYIQYYGAGTADTTYPYPGKPSGFVYWMSFLDMPPLSLQNYDITAPYLRQFGQLPIPFVYPPPPPTDPLGYGSFWNFNLMLTGQRYSPLWTNPYDEYYAWEPAPFGGGFIGGTPEGPTPIIVP
jgi:hypothetical protein